MKRKRRKAPNDIQRIFEEGTAIDAALNRAAREAVLQHKKAGNPVATWRGGKVVWLQPEEIKLPRR